MRILKDQNGNNNRNNKKRKKCGLYTSIPFISYVTRALQFFFLLNHFFFFLHILTSKCSCP